jgi:hypothetical protein
LRGWFRRYGAELLTAASALVGWGLLTFALSSILGWIVWPVSGGLLALSLVGWRMVGIIAWSGLYALTRDEEEE